MKLIYDKDFLSFQITKDNKTLVEGGHTQVVKYVLDNDLMDLSDFLYAVEEMTESGDTVSLFGVCGGFMWTEAS